MIAGWASTGAFFVLCLLALVALPRLERWVMADQARAGFPVDVEPADVFELDRAPSDTVGRRSAPGGAR